MPGKWGASDAEYRHLEGEDRLRFEREVEGDDAVEVARTALILSDGLVVESVEREVAGGGSRLRSLDDSGERHPAPLSNGRPALNAVVLHDLRCPAQCAQLVQSQAERMLDQAGDFEAVLAETVRSQGPVVVVGWGMAVDPVVRGDVGQA